MIDKGLNEEVAFNKVSKLLKNSNTDKLNHIYNSSELLISKEKLNNAFVKYALYEKNLDFNSYDSLIGLIQSASVDRLDNKQLRYVKQIASRS